MAASEAPSAVAQVAVFGSLNMDFVVRVPRAPEAGETLQAHALLTNPGGKGANQAVACARMGARVAMIGCVGADDFGTQLRKVLEADAIDTQRVRVAGPTSGVAVILVDDAAENRIAIVPGANAEVTAADAEAADVLRSAAITVLQFEVPMDAVVRAAELAHGAGKRVLLNPAPVRALPAALWPYIDILVVNETEAAVLAGTAVADVSTAKAAAEALRAHGPKTVVLTLGAEGVVVADTRGSRHVPAVKVQAVDTTAAGDTFIGAFTAALVDGLSVDAAIERGVRAAAICVTRPGAQDSIPYLRELEPTT